MLPIYQRKPKNRTLSLAKAFVRIHPRNCRASVYAPLRCVFRLLSSLSLCEPLANPSVTPREPGKQTHFSAFRDTMNAVHGIWMLWIKTLSTVECIAFSGEIISDLQASVVAVSDNFWCIDETTCIQIQYR